MLARRGDRRAAESADLLVVALAVVWFGLLLIVPRPGFADHTGPPLPSPEYTRTPPATTATPTGSPSPSVSPDPTPTPGSSTPRGSADPTRSSPRVISSVDRTPWQLAPSEPSTRTPAAVVVSPPPPPDNRPPQGVPADAGQVTEAIARGLIVGGSAGFVVSLIGMMLVGWLRRRV